MSELNGSEDQERGVKGLHSLQVICIYKVEECQRKKSGSKTIPEVRVSNNMVGWLKAKMGLKKICLF